MFQRGPEYMRKTANMVLDALLQAVREGYADKPLHPDDLARIVDATKASTDLDHFYRASFDELQRVAEDDSHRTTRINAFGRLVVHPLSDHFEAGRLDRRLIGNFFFFVRSLFGDRVEAFADEANAVAEEYRARGELETWDAFYADPRMKRIYYQVMARVVRAFKVFEARRDWVMKVMQHDPTNTALSSTVYVQGNFDGEAMPFGPREFFLFFDSLIRPLRDLQGEDKALFVEVVGEEPVAMVGDFLMEMTRVKPAD
ncbi:hypothetical protein [Ferrovibrio sp.]|uniref:hypothetical protein n=1 Tax=Ferrovibrio sp. TaxID=1917215 RepID=UPI0035AE8963